MQVMAESALDVIEAPGFGKSGKLEAGAAPSGILVPSPEPSDPSCLAAVGMRSLSNLPAGKPILSMLHGAAGSEALTAPGIGSAGEVARAHTAV